MSKGSSCRHKAALAGVGLSTRLFSLHSVTSQKWRMRSLFNRGPRTQVMVHRACGRMLTQLLASAGILVFSHHQPKVLPQRNWDPRSLRGSKPPKVCPSSCFLKSLGSHDTFPYLR